MLDGKPRIYRIEVTPEGRIIQDGVMLPASEWDEAYIEYLEDLKEGRETPLDLQAAAPPTPGN